MGPGEGRGDKGIGLWEPGSLNMVSLCLPGGGAMGLKSSISPTPPVGSVCSEVLMAVATSRLAQYICPNAAYLFFFY